LRVRIIETNWESGFDRRDIGVWFKNRIKNGNQRLAYDNQSFIRGPSDGFKPYDENFIDDSIQKRNRDYLSGWKAKTRLSSRRKLLFPLKANQWCSGFTEV
jgi:hypothetical protein